MAGIELDVRIDPKSLARVTKRLDSWKGAPLAIRTDRALAGGARLMADALKARAPRGKTGGLRRSVKVTPLGRRDVVSRYQILPTKRVPDKKRRDGDLLAALLVYGTKRGVEPTPFVDEVAHSLEGRVMAFVEEQITRLE